MIWLTAFLAGFLFALATWLMLHRDWLRIVFGVMVLGHGANLVLLSASGEPGGKLPPITGGDGVMVDPLPQALLLTAIVIGFAVVAFFISLVYRILSEGNGLQIEDLFE